MTALDVELALDRLAGRLASELPPHVAAAADAYAREGRGPAPIVLGDAELRALRAGLREPGLHQRAVRLLRAVAPFVIDGDPRVRTARAVAPTWAALAELNAVRAYVAHERLGIDARALVDALAGIDVGIDGAGIDVGIDGAGIDDGHIDDGHIDDGHIDDGHIDDGRIDDGHIDDGHIDDGHIDDGAAPPPLDDATIADGRVRDALSVLPAPIAGWADSTGDDLTDDAIRAVWAQLTAGEAFGALAIVRSPRPARMFAIERGRRGVIVVPVELRSPRARFTVLHELGHALLWLAPTTRARGIEWPRLVDEAVAAWVARGMERAGALPPGWYSPLATAARARRLRIARVLAAVERTATIVRAPTVLVRAPTTSGRAPTTIGGAPTTIDRTATLGRAPTALARTPARVARAVEVATAARHELARPPAALWDEPGIQRVYVRAEALADALERELAGLRGDRLVQHVAARADAIDDAALPPGGAARVV